jgi:hypothetical protein
MRSVLLIGDCHSTRVWQHWNPNECKLDFKVWGLAGMTAYAFDPEKLRQEKTPSSGIENYNMFVMDKHPDAWKISFDYFKRADLVLVWLGYVDIRQWLPKHKNTEEVVINYLERVRSYYRGSRIQLIEPLPQFTEMLLKYEGISPSYTYEERQEINKIFIDTMNAYAKEHNMLKPITQDEIREAVGLKEFTPEDCATFAPHPQDSLKREYWKKIYDLFIRKSESILPAEENLAKNIAIVSPQGSGNTFGKSVLSSINLNCSVLPTNHSINKLRDKDTNRIFLLRNPYHAVASAVELEISNLKKQKMYAIERRQQENQIKESAANYIESYRLFVEEAKNNKDVVSFTFEFLTQQTEGFIEKVIKAFDIKSKDYVFNKDYSLDNIKNQSLPGRDRAPREKSETRILIDEVVSNMDQIKPVYNIYLSYKEEIERNQND